MKIIHNLLLFFILFSLSHVVNAKNKKIKKFFCDGQLVLTQHKKRITCRFVSISKSKAITCRKSINRCHIGAVVIHPRCMKMCHRRENAKCWHWKMKQKRVCKKKPLYLVIPCPTQAKKWRKRCVKQAAHANKRCRERALSKPCRHRFNKARHHCNRARKRATKKCKRKLEWKLKKCKILGRKILKRRLLTCGKKFNRCVNFCVGRHWPCRKRCFSKRHRCIHRNRGQESSCRDIAARLRVECSISGDKKQAQCVKKAELKMYSCMQQFSRRRIICIIDVGKRYRRCVGKVRDRQLGCFFKQMDYKYLCSGEAYRDCRRILSRKIRKCYRRNCPHCRIVR